MFFQISYLFILHILPNFSKDHRKKVFENNENNFKAERLLRTKTKDFNSGSLPSSQTWHDGNTRVVRTVNVKLNIAVSKV